MSDTKFTKGPWVIDPATRPTEVCTIHHTNHENGFVYVRGALGYWDADGEECMANAHLIAADPALYAKAVELHSYLIEEDQNYMGSQAYLETKALLANARGDTQ
jgi:hypothetical protein